MREKFKEEIFFDLIHKMNLEANQDERNQWNRYRCDLWETCDSLRDMCRASENTRLIKKIEDLFNLVSKLPIIEE